MKRVAINGLGRIGRMVVRHYMEVHPKDVNLVAANDLVPTDDLAYLIKYDSAHGKQHFQSRQTNTLSRWVKQRSMVHGLSSIAIVRKRMMPNGAMAGILI
jgi:glyceraldehyde-3-phosphate dehydrogenase/erythrose-4-phosphate dehydrogenase